MRLIVRKLTALNQEQLTLGSHSTQSLRLGYIQVEQLSNKVGDVGNTTTVECLLSHDFHISHDFYIQPARKGRVHRASMGARRCEAGRVSRQLFCSPSAQVCLKGMI
jgi:hypothetical protein